MEPETIRALFAALRDENVDYVLVGALAMDVLGIGRLTEDIDLFVRPTEANVDRLRRALRRVWQDPSIDEITAADLAGDYPAIQYVAPDGTPIDILSQLRSSGSRGEHACPEVPHPRRSCAESVARPG